MSVQAQEQSAGEQGHATPCTVVGGSAGWGVNLGRGERVGSAVVGAALVAGGLVLGGRGRGRRRGLVLGLAGTVLLTRGLTGHSALYAALATSPEAPPGSGVLLSRSITVLRPRAAVYRGWRDLERLPRFARHVREVRELGGGRSRWVARGPGGSRLEWTAALTEDLPDERIAWRTLPGTPLQHEGTVSFSDAPGGRGTELRLQLRSAVPGGRVGLLLARLLGEESALRVGEELRRFKRLMEAGEVVASVGT